MGRGTCKGCGVAGHYQTRCPVNPRVDPRIARRQGLDVPPPVSRRRRPERPAAPPAVVDGVALKIVRTRAHLVEAAELIEELRGGRPAVLFRKWIEWWDRISARRAPVDSPR